MNKSARNLVSVLNAESKNKWFVYSLYDKESEETTDQTRKKEIENMKNGLIHESIAIDRIISMIADPKQLKVYAEIFNVTLE